MHYPSLLCTDALRNRLWVTLAFIQSALLRAWTRHHAQRLIAWNASPQLFFRRTILKTPYFFGNVTDSLVTALIP